MCSRWFFPPRLHFSLVHLVCVSVRASSSSRIVFLISCLTGFHCCICHSFASAAFRFIPCRHTITNRFFLRGYGPAGSNIPSVARPMNSAETENQSEGIQGIPRRCFPRGFTRSFLNNFPSSMMNSRPRVTLSNLARNAEPKAIGTNQKSITGEYGGDVR